MMYYTGVVSVDYNFGDKFGGGCHDNLCYKLLLKSPEQIFCAGLNGGGFSESD